MNNKTWKVDNKDTDKNQYIYLSIHSLVQYHHEFDFFQIGDISSHS